MKIGRTIRSARGWRLKIPKSLPSPNSITTHLFHLCQNLNFRHYLILFISKYVDVNRCVAHPGPLNDAPVVCRVYPDGHIHNVLGKFTTKSMCTFYHLFSTILQPADVFKFPSSLRGPPLSRMIVFQFYRDGWIAIPLTFRM